MRRKYVCRHVERVIFCFARSTRGFWGGLFHFFSRRCSEGVPCFFSPQPSVPRPRPPAFWPKAQGLASFSSGGVRGPRRLRQCAQGLAGGAPSPVSEAAAVSGVTAGFAVPKAKTGSEAAVVSGVTGGFAMPEAKAGSEAAVVSGVTGDRCACFIIHPQPFFPAPQLANSQCARAH